GAAGPRGRLEETALPAGREVGEQGEDLLATGRGQRSGGGGAPFGGGAGALGRVGRFEPGPDLGGRALGGLAGAGPAALESLGAAGAARALGEAGLGRGGGLAAGSIADLGAESRSEGREGHVGAGPEAVHGSARLRHGPRDLLARRLPPGRLAGGGEVGGD